jgi:hypothetical protein
VSATGERQSQDGYSGSGSLRGEVRTLGRTWSSGHYRLVRLVAALDDSGEWAWDGASTCARWVADAIDIDESTAREWLRIGHLLGKLQEVDDAFASGRLSYSKVRTLTRVVTLENQHDLCEIAARVPASRLAYALGKWLSDNEEPEETERRHRGASGLWFRSEPDGMQTATLRAPPHEMATVIAAIETWVRQNQPQPESGQKATESGQDASADGCEPLSVNIWPSWAQQRCDALVALISGGGLTGITEVVVHVRGDGCTFDDGTPVVESVMARLIPDAFIRMLIHDAERRPINASGRHRHPTMRQKRVVRERDRACVDCGSTRTIEFDHDPPFEVSHRTVIDELVTRCGKCHRDRHKDPRTP